MAIDLNFTLVLYFSISIFSTLIALGIKNCSDGNTRLLLRFVLFLVLLIPSIFRYDIGADYSTYEICYNNKNIYFSEIGFSWICNFLISHNCSSWWLFFTIAILTYFPISFFIKRTQILIFVFSYVFFMGYLKSYDGIRQACALPYLVISMSCFFEKKYLKMLILTFIAYSMHSSSLFFILLLLISKLIKNERLYKVGFFLAIVLIITGIFKKILFSIIDSYIPIYAHYLESSYGEGAKLGSGLGIIIAITFPFYLLFCRQKTEKHSEYLIMNVFYILFRLLAIQFSIIGRVADVVWCGTLLSYTELYYIKSKYKKLIYLIFIIFGILTLYKGVTGQVGPGTSEISPYKSIFER